MSSSENETPSFEHDRLLAVREYLLEYADLYKARSAARQTGETETVKILDAEINQLVKQLYAADEREADRLISIEARRLAVIALENEQISK